MRWSNGDGALWAWLSGGGVLEFQCALGAGSPPTEAMSGWCRALSGHRLLIQEKSYANLV